MLLLNLAVRPPHSARRCFAPSLLSADDGLDAYDADGLDAYDAEAYDLDKEFSKEVAQRASTSKAAAAQVTARYLRGYRARGLDLEDLDASSTIPPRGHNVWAQKLPRGVQQVSASPIVQPAKAPPTTTMQTFGSFIANIRVDVFLATIAMLAIVLQLLPASAAEGPLDAPAASELLAAASAEDADMIMLAPSPSELPIQLETPLGPIAGTPSQMGLLGLGVLSASATLLRGVSDGLSGRTSSSVSRSEQQAQQPFGRSVEDTISKARALTQPVDENAPDDR